MVLISLVSVLNLLYFYISTIRSMCAVPNMAVFCSSLTSCFPGMLLTYFPHHFEIVPVAPIISGIAFFFLLLLLLLLLLGCHSVAVVLTLVQTKQIRINVHKRSNTRNTVQTIQNTANTSTRVLDTIYTRTHTHTQTVLEDSQRILSSRTTVL